MRWFYPKLFWAQMIPLLVVLGWILAERSRRRRLGVFGDSRILGVPALLSRRTSALAVLVLGFAATSAILPMPAREDSGKGVVPALVEILLDSKLFDDTGSEGSSALDAADYQVRAIFQMARLSHFSVYRSARPIELLVPATSDSQGLLIVMGRLRQERQRGDLSPLSESVDALVRRESSKRQWLRKIVVITSQPYQALSGSLSSSQIGPSLLWVRLTTEDRQPIVRSKETSWIWSDDSPALREFLTSNKGQEPEEEGVLAGYSYIQYLAGVAFLAFLFEALLGFYVQSRVGWDSGG